MDKSEPTLVPEWLKSSGTVTGGVATNHQFASLSLHPDDRSTLKPARNKSLVNISDHDLGRSSVSDRTTSSYFRRSSSTNGSAHLRSHGSFGRSNRDRDWDKDIYEYRDNEKSNLGDHRHRNNYSDTLGSILPSRFEKDGLRRTQSTLSRKRGEPWPRKVPVESSSASKNNYNNGNTRLAGSSPASSVHKIAFDRDFPSLGADERQTEPEIGRIPSPGVSTAIQSLPIGSSAVIGDGGWTSALAEVPVMIGGNGTSALSVAQAVLPSSPYVSSSMTAGLNMAETLVQGPPRVQTTAQLSVGTQWLEELAIKQSRQLIPVTPSMPKALVSNPLEKPKPKVGQQQHQNSSTHIVNHSPRGVPTKSDISKTSTLGKLQVLKPARERNGISYTKDSLSPTSGSKVANNPLAAAPSAVGSAPLRTPVNNPILAIAERKPVPAALVPPILEKRPTSQAQSRNDFFNLVRKKSMTNSSAVPDSVSAVSPSVEDKHGEADVAASLIPQGRDSPSADRVDGDQMSETGGRLICNSDSCDGRQKSLENGENHSCSDVIPYSEEEEAAFMRSLGWDESESAGEDEGLTEEEISAFYRDVSKYINSGPSSKTFLGTKPKFLVPLNLQMGSIGGVSSGVSSSDSKLDP